MKLFRKDELTSIIYMYYKLVLVFAVTCSLAVSCIKTEEKRQKPLHETEIGDPYHNARNSLDYTGVYTGVIPWEDGIKWVETFAERSSATALGVVDIRRDNVCVIKTKRAGSDETIWEMFAAYEWNDAGNVITVEMLPVPVSFFVGEGYLILLEKEDDTITGDIADRYILKKE